MLSEGSQKALNKEKQASARYQEKNPKPQQEVPILAVSTPNKFELTKKFQLTGIIDPGQPGAPAIDVYGLHQYVDARDQVSNWCLG